MLNLSDKSLKIFIKCSCHFQLFFTEEPIFENSYQAITDASIENQQLGFVAGVVERERILGFERILWRISMGNILMRHADIEKPFNDPKTVSHSCRILETLISPTKFISGQGDPQECLCCILPRRAAQVTCQEGLCRLSCVALSMPQQL
jgi:hypothetical protein